ncbi:MAG: type IV pilin protein [Gammaproteobacteria bacterium]
MKPRGFSLLELMVVVVIVTILIAIAVPLYLHVQERARRTQAVNALQTMATREEAYYSRYNIYAASTTSLGYPSTVMTEGGYYAVSIFAAGATSYNLHAIPQAVGQQDHDACKTFILDSRGNESVTGSASVTDCWQ